MERQKKTTTKIYFVQNGVKVAWRWSQLILISLIIILPIDHEKNNTTKMQRVQNVFKLRVVVISLIYIHPSILFPFI